MSRSPQGRSKNRKSQPYLQKYGTTKLRRLVPSGPAKHTLPPQETHSVNEVLIKGDYVSDARMLTLPALNIVALVTFAVIGTWGVSSYKFDVETRIAEVRTQLSRLENHITTNTTEMRAQLNNAWGRTDMYVWCKDVESSNKGFRCPAVGGNRQ